MVRMKRGFSLRLGKDVEEGDVTGPTARPLSLLGGLGSVFMGLPGTALLSPALAQLLECP